MSEAGVDNAPTYSFKPIELELASPIDPSLDPNTSGDSIDIGLCMSPGEIFRGSDEGDIMFNDAALPFVRRANPIYDQQSSAGVDSEEEEEYMEDETCRRVISPYPFSHTSKEEIEELEQLTNAFDWNLQGAQNDNSRGCHEKKFSIEVDYSRFFQHGVAVGDQVMDEYDDFSLSSHEANSLSEDLCLGSISEDPASFWEEGIVPILLYRNESSTQVSLGSAES
jgi:hypothetical protein